MRRRRKRKREKISKAQGAADSAQPDSQAAASAAGFGDDAAGKEEEDEKLTAADELAPMQVCSHCHLTSPRLQCCALCLALHQHALNWLHCYYMHNGSAFCNHGLQTRVASYHACACTNMPQVSESRRGCMRSQLIGSLMDQAAGVFQ